MLKQDSSQAIALKDQFVEAVLNRNSKDAAATIDSALALGLSPGDIYVTSYLSLKY